PTQGQITRSPPSSFSRCFRQRMMSTAFPQPAPGTAPNPGPMVVPAGKLHSVLGVTAVKVVRGHSHLAVVDHTLAETA
ncbi:MAG TPA: hypothetical protein VMU57_07195, partial [Edaphobacter sp.]|nr:hypothetical protein [Edaphobacter sp.]